MKKSESTLIGFIAIGSLIVNNIIFNPSQAFVPFVFEPNAKELNTTAINLGQTAIQLLQINQNKEALEVLKLAIKLNPREANLWILLADTQIKLNHTDKGINSIKRAIKLNPTKASLWFAISSIYIKMNKPVEAISYARQGIKLDKNNANGYFLLGNTNLMMNKLYIALNSFEKAAKINPKFWQAINNEGLVLYELDQKEKAIKKWKKAISIKKDGEPLLALAVALYNTDNQKDNAILLAKEALTLNPNYVNEKHQKEQLWGQKLRKATKILFKNPKMIKSTEKAKTISK